MKSYLGLLFFCVCLILCCGQPEPEETLKNLNVEEIIANAKQECSSSWVNLYNPAVIDARMKEYNLTSFKTEDVSKIPKVCTQLKEVYKLKTDVFNKARNAAMSNQGVRIVDGSGGGAKTLLALNNPQVLSGIKWLKYKFDPQTGCSASYAYLSYDVKNVLFQYAVSNEGHIIERVNSRQILEMPLRASTCSKIAWIYIGVLP